jgi:hypothetical protein
MADKSYWPASLSEALHRTIELVFDGAARIVIGVLIFLVIAVISHKARGAEVSKEWVLDGIVAACGSIFVGGCVFLFYLFVILPQEQSAAYYNAVKDRDALEKKNATLESNVQKQAGELEKASTKLDTLSLAAGVSTPGGLNEKLDQFLSDFEKTKATLKKVEERAPPPAEQAVVTAVSTVEVTISSSAAVNSNFMDQGGYLLFGKGTTPVLITSATSCTGVQTGSGSVVYRGVFSADQARIQKGQKVSALGESDYIQISFVPMPPKSIVIGGHAVIVLNNGIRLEYEIPPQQMADEKIMIPGSGAEAKKQLGVDN